MSADPPLRPFLAIETSCDETAAAVVVGGRVVLSSVVASQVELHAPFGGVFPEVAARRHILDIGPTVAEALSQAGVGLPDLAAIAVTRGPGLVGALLVGVNAAKGLSLATGLPVIGVNHLAGHIYSNWLHTAGRVHGPADLAGLERGDGPPEPPTPHLAMVVSGGHTEIWLFESHARIRHLGGTIDDAAGEAFDKAARMLGLGYPGGPAIQQAAQSGDPASFALPIGRTENELDVSFSGLKTALRRTIENLGGDPDRPPGSGPEAGMPVADLAAAFEAAVVAALLQRAQRALRAHPVRAVLLSGGVSANSALRSEMSVALDVPVVYPPPELCTDNAAMIGAAAALSASGTSFGAAAGAGSGPPWKPKEAPSFSGGLALEVESSLGLGSVD